MVYENRSVEIELIASALCKAQGEMQNATMNKVNSYFNSRYATLGAIRDAIREPLAKNGLCVTQTTAIGEKGIILNTVLIHTSGQWISSEFPLPFFAKPQEMGSALTYAKRYQLSAIVGIAADEDDDANAAEGKLPAKQFAKPPAPPKSDPISSGLRPMSEHMIPPTAASQAIFSPEKIDVPLLEDESGSDWMAWGQSFMAAARSSPDAASLKKLEENNATPMKNMEISAPKMYANMAVALIKVRKAMEKTNA